MVLLLCVWLASIQRNKTIECISRDKIPVSLQNSEIKPLRQGHSMEVMLKTATQILQSPKVDEVTDEDVP